MRDALTLCTVPPTTHWRSPTTPIRAVLLYATALPVGQLLHCSLQARGAQPPLSHFYPIAGMPLGRFVLPLCRACVLERVTGYPGCGIAVTTIQSGVFYFVCRPCVELDSATPQDQSHRSCGVAGFSISTGRQLVPVPGLSDTALLEPSLIQPCACVLFILYSALCPRSPAIGRPPAHGHPLPLKLGCTLAVRRGRATPPLQLTRSSFILTLSPTPLSPFPLLLLHHFLCLSSASVSSDSVTGSNGVRHSA